jgi:hypothetical protein
VISKMNGFVSSSLYPRHENTLVFFHSSRFSPPASSSVAASAESTAMHAAAGEASAVKAASHRPSEAPAAKSMTTGEMTSGPAGAIVRPWAPTVEIVIEMTGIMTIIVEGAEAHEPRRKESPTEWAVKDAVSGNKGVAIKPGIPIPAIVEHGGLSVIWRLVLICFRDVSRSQIAPAIQIVSVEVFFVELLYLQGYGLAEFELTSALQFDLPVAGPHGQLAVEDPDEAAIGIEFVEARLQQVR